MFAVQVHSPSSLALAACTYLVSSLLEESVGVSLCNPSVVGPLPLVRTDTAGVGEGDSSPKARVEVRVDRGPAAGEQV